jgi:hypothetical protein
LTRHLEDVGPTVEHGKQVVTILHVRERQHPRLLRYVEPGGRIERIGVRGGDVAVESGYDLARTNWPIGARVPSGAAKFVITRRVNSMVTSG